MARRSQRGLTLIELLLAVAIGAIVFAALNSLVMQSLKAQASGRAGNELVYQGRFALERMVATARGTAPKLLAAPAAGTTGDWFSPAMYCRNAGGQLIETVTTDTGCSGTTVIASNVSALSAALPASAGAVDRPLAALSLTLGTSAAPQAVTLASGVRLGGGTQ